MGNENVQIEERLTHLRWERFNKDRRKRLWSACVHASWHAGQSLAAAVIGDRYLSQRKRSILTHSHGLGSSSEHTNDDRR
jgi:hypothetical protein